MRRWLLRSIVVLGFLLPAGLAPSASAGVGYGVVIVTKENGRPATDVCYVLVDYSNEGCDENGDGWVQFDRVPPGTYTVHQTADLGPGRHVDDFQITTTATGGGVYEYFSAEVIDTPGTHPEGAVDIALITRAPGTGALLTGACYVLVDYSNEGCDENTDGQVDFAAIPFGDYTVHQTRAPEGYTPIDDYTITVPPTSVPTGFVVKQAAEQNAPGTRNVSFILVDAATDARVVGDTCMRIIDASNIGCDERRRDGQIDFLDVPTGSYHFEFTRMPDGYTVVDGPDAFRVDVGGDRTPANVIVYVALARGA